MHKGWVCMTCGDLHFLALAPRRQTGLSAGTDEERTEWIEAITPFLGKAVYTEAGVLASATKDRPSVKSGRRPPTRAGRKSRAKAKAKARPAVGHVVLCLLSCEKCGPCMFI